MKSENKTRRGTEAKYTDTKEEGREILMHTYHAERWTGLVIGILLLGYSVRFVQQGLPETPDGVAACSRGPGRAPVGFCRLEDHRSATNLAPAE